MFTYVKLHGPGIEKGIEALRKIAFEMPQVCIMDTFIDLDWPDTSGSPGTIGSSGGGVGNFASYYFEGKVPKERCDTIISKSGEKLGDYDFYFEWTKKPTGKEYSYFLSKIDEALTPLNIKYTLTSK